MAKPEDFDHHADVRRYDPAASDAHIEAIIEHLGIALRGQDSSLVSCSDEGEVTRIRDGFCKKKLDLEPEPAMALVTSVCTMMQEDRNKRRVTFLYLLAKQSEKLDRL